MPPGRRSLGWIVEVRRRDVGRIEGRRPVLERDDDVVAEQLGGQIDRAGLALVPVDDDVRDRLIDRLDEVVDARCRRLARASHLADGGADVRESLDIGVDVQLAADGWCDRIKRVAGHFWNTCAIGSSGASPTHEHVQRTHQCQSGWVLYSKSCVRWPVPDVLLLHRQPTRPAPSVEFGVVDRQQVVHLVASVSARRPFGLLVPVGIATDLRPGALLRRYSIRDALGPAPTPIPASILRRRREVPDAWIFDHALWETRNRIVARTGCPDAGGSDRGRQGRDRATSAR